MFKKTLIVTNRNGRELCRREILAETAREVEAMFEIERQKEKGPDRYLFAKKSEPVKLKEVAE